MSGEPVESEPVSGESVESEPVAVEPVESEPVAGEPVASEPVSGEPVESEPTSEEPVESEPVAVELSRAGDSVRATRASRATRTSPPRTASCWTLSGRSSRASAAASALQEASSPSTSTSTQRPGLSNCAERTKPHTGASARFGTSSSGPAATAPRVRSTRRELAKRSSASHACNSSSTCAETAWAASGRELCAPSAEHSTSTTSGSSAPPSSTVPSASRFACVCTSTPAARSARTRGESSPPSTPTSSRRKSGRPSGSATHSWRNSVWWWPARAPARSRSESGRIASDPTVATGAPVESEIASDAALAPAGESRTRSESAPVACRTTPLHENGSHASSPSPSLWLSPWPWLCARQDLSPLEQRRPQRMQGRVQQSRVHAERLRVGLQLGGQRDLREQLLAQVPRSPQALERRPKLETTRGGPVVRGSRRPRPRRPPAATPPRRAAQAARGGRAGHSRLRGEGPVERRELPGGEHTSGVARPVLPLPGRAVGRTLGAGVRTRASAEQTRRAPPRTAATAPRPRGSAPGGPPAAAPAPARSRRERRRAGRAPGRPCPAAAPRPPRRGRQATGGSAARGGR